MAALGPTAFGILVWGVIALVLVILVYEVYVIVQELA